MPFLKNRKLPRIAQDGPDEKLINGSESDYMDEFVMGELMDAYEHKDIGKFRSALEALVMNSFDWDDENGK